MLTKKEEINKKIGEYVEKMCSPWGVHVEQIILKDMRMSQMLRENLSIVPKTKR